MPKVANGQEARAILLAAGYMKKDDPNLPLTADILAFLDDPGRFEPKLTDVSKAIWVEYLKLDQHLKNKFSISLGIVAQRKKFRVSNKPTTAPHPDALDIKLVGSYGDFFGLLRDKWFWKDSMDMEHGEYSHALQWLAIAEQFDARAADLYSKLPDYKSGGKKGTSIPLWSFLADCFPDTKKAEPELTVNTYRSPQWITKHLLGTQKPIDGHFVSAYLNYVYRQRNLVSYDKTKLDTIKANYGSSSARALDPSRTKDWDPRLEKGKVTRLDRKPDAEKRDASKQQSFDVTFHGIAGKFWTKGDWNNVMFFD